MSKTLPRSFLACAVGLVVAAGSSTQAAELTARDLRMETRTQWDYQPLQGPRFHAREHDIFTPGSDEAIEEPQTPPPPVEPGDWRTDPPRAEDMVPPPSHPKDPKTVTSLEVGGQTSFYHYHEKDLGVKLQGPQGGVQVVATGAFGSQWFVRADGKFTAGNLYYKGSGEDDDNPNYTAEARITIGRDFLTRNFGISPYVGVGYRFLHSDDRGISTTGYYGYQRDSHYLFLPIGVQPRMQFPNGDRLTLTAEYDPLLQGWQYSYLSDIYYGYPDLANKQKAGYGLRGDLMYQRDNWSFGPYVNYWNINQSDLKCGSNHDNAYIYTFCGVEPHNHTVEYGLQFRYRFYED